MIDVSIPYRVIKAGNFRFELDTSEKITVCSSRKKVRLKGEILVGDMVNLECVSGEYAIKSVVARKNSLIRPAVANVDQIVMLISPVPEPDYLLVDKLILNCHAKNIDCILCVNKTDIDDLTEFVKKEYSASVKAVVSISAMNGAVDELKPYLAGKLTCFAGQSAVGKSSLANALTGTDNHKTGDVSEKSQRGKNTTTVASLIPIENDGYIVDTPGFSMLDVFDIDGDELDLYYPEYVELSGRCKYRRCTHTVEPGCYVKNCVESGILSKTRYERYVTLLTTLKNNKKY